VKAVYIIIGILIGSFGTLTLLFTVGTIAGARRELDRVRGRPHLRVVGGGRP